MRRPEYAAATGAAVSHGAGDYGEGFRGAAAPKRRSPLALLEASGASSSTTRATSVRGAREPHRLFLHAYLVMNAAYAARAMLGIVAIKLGRKP